MNRMKIVALFGCLLAIATVAQAQSADPFADNFKFYYGFNKRNVIAAAEKMPAADYGFKPTSEVRTFGEVLGHIVDVQNMACSAIKGEANPSKEPTEKTAKTKDDWVKAVKASFEYCDGAFNTLTDAKLIEKYKGSRGEYPKSNAASLAVYHTSEHYGNLVVYLRLKGIVPPSSEPAPPQKAETKPAPDQSKPPQFDLDSYQFGFLRKGPNSGTGTKEEAEKIQAGHMANINKMAAMSKLMAAGPMGDNGDLRGIFLFKTASLDEAKALAAEDPAIKAGRLRMDIFTWMGPKGIGKEFSAKFQANPKTPATMTQFYLALLSSGPKASAGTTAEQQKILLEHLWNIRRRLDDKSFVAAGPFGDAGDLRGIFVIAAKTAEEAKAIAESDPMVKAGVVSVELHPWWVAKEVWP